MYNFGAAYCHGAARGSRNEETRIETNGVFNVEQTEEAQDTGKNIDTLT